MRVLEHRGEVIDWAGRVHACPAVRSDDAAAAALVHAGDDEAGLTRVGWKTFFAALDRAHQIIAVEASDGFAHRVLTRSQARAELQAEAFGPPWYRRLWHEIMLVEKQ